MDTPHRVVVVATPGVVAFDLMVPVQVFRRVTRSRYQVTIAGLEAGQVYEGHGMEVRAARGLDALDEADTVMLPGLDDVGAPAPPQLIDAVLRAHARGARLASICTGAFYLAQTGLLNHRTATTHWALAAEFSARFPKVKVDPNALYVDHGDVVTSAGATAGIDMCLHIVRHDFGERVANSVAKLLVASPHRNGAQAQVIARPMPPTRTRHLGPVCTWAIEHLDEPLTVTALAERAGLTTRSLSRRFQDEMGMSPLQWLNEQRVRKAQALLEASALSVEQVAQQCGFGGVLPCRRHFRKLVGVSPQQYRRDFVAREARS
ncbi:GlxA family transcriptional regulator [Ramlibacter albus]|uniref:DJ-1/PfpI family protein n=1 Tax=Ramlibacter albus TaxID=2079448 RepID=A0A923S5F4_9BURK|nr:helix-turn-helix domain-containing protein [Ramlibacter albus]MBC5765112.1 DJ-1/PfpI family protein [Ramlibacter albus]